MKLSTLLEIIGSGSILLVVGVGLLLVGVGIGASDSLHVPMWATFCGLGLITAIAGAKLIDHGTDEAEIQVAKQMPLLKNIIHSPWLTVGASIVGGILLQRMLRSRKEVVIANIATPIPAQIVDPAPIHTQHAEPTSTDNGFGISQYFGDQLRSLGPLAAGLAVSFAKDALGIPSMEQLIEDLLNGEKKPEKPSEETAAAPPDECRYDNLLREEDYQSSSQGNTYASASHTHNGVH